MKVLYRSQNLMDAIQETIKAAEDSGRIIAAIVLTVAEFAELKTRFGIGYGHLTYIDGVLIKQE